MDALKAWLRNYKYKSSQINQGILNSERLNGDYPGITGIGTIVSGTWNGTEISDQYIDNTLTLTNAIIQEKT